MSDYRRWFVPGGTFFFSVVTYHRARFLTTPLARQCLRDAMERVRKTRPFDIVAIVLLPDHLHTVWSMPPDDSDYSVRWQKIKEGFSKAYLSAGGKEIGSTVSRRRQQQRGLWQKRFWEHTCRDEDAIKKCVDYLHYNPVKHGLVGRVQDYPWSTFHRFVRLGEYDTDWGGENPCPDWNMLD
ncbi:MAG TPA: transposase [Thermoguttaceae bacterium]|nr:transposase [Thermoguttaceae bacterium]